MRGKEEAKHFLNTVVCRFVSVIRVESSRPIGVVLTYLDCLSELSDRRHCAQTGSCFTFSCGQKFREMQLADERGYVRSHNVFATIVVKIKQWPMVTPQHLPHSPCLSQGSQEASTWNSPGHFLEDLKGLGYQAGFRPQAGKASALLSLLSISIQSNETHTKKNKSRICQGHSSSHL